RLGKIIANLIHQGLIFEVSKPTTQILFTTSNLAIAYLAANPPTESLKCLLVKEVGLASNKDLGFGMEGVSHNKFVIFSEMRNIKDMTHEQIILQGREQMITEKRHNKMVPLVFPLDALAIAYLAANPPTECARKEILYNPIDLIRMALSLQK
ncbi:hypothetical protein ACJX0J_024800, partial [Zea mays]